VLRARAFAFWRAAFMSLHRFLHSWPDGFVLLALPFVAL
jgi:hypothetical protein